MTRRHHPALLASALALACALAHGRASAHGIAPVLLEIDAREDGTATVLWKTAPSLPRGAHLEPVLPARCRTVGSPASGQTTEGVTRSLEIDCGPSGLVGETIAVSDLDVARTDALLRIALPDGREIRTVLRGDRPAFVVPDRELPAGTFVRALRTGLSGLARRTDTFLFVGGLVLLARDRRSLGVAIAAFVLANSATLLAAALGAIAPRPRLGEFLAAASAIAIAAEAARAEQDGLGRRSPWIPAAILGAIHGIVLAPDTMPTSIESAPSPVAILGHHLGVEASLAAFAAVAGAAWLALRAALGGRRGAALAAGAARAIAYPLGCAAAFLAIERAARLVG